MELEILANRTLLISLDECRACHPPPSLNTSCSLHREYENGSGKENKKGGIQKRGKRRNAGNEIEERGK